MFLFVHISFRWLFIFSSNDVGNRDITIWRFCRYGQVNNWFCNIPCIFIWWDVISSNMEDNMIWFISHYWFDMVYHTPYLFTVRWPDVDITVSSLPTFTHPFKCLRKLSPTINSRLLSCLFPTYWLSLNVVAAVISLDIKLFLFMPLLPSCRWFFLDIFS